MIKTNINEFLLIKNYSSNGLDEINSLAITEQDAHKRLQLLTSAINELEKFHSFFHFEQSYFHLQLGILYLKNKQLKEAREEFENAIFQDHLNHQAIFLKNKNNYIHSDPIYKRPFSDFKSYLIFATNNNFKNFDNLDNYWHYADNPAFLKEIIKKVRYNHSNYHTESAKFYLNRADTFASCGQHDLAKNDIIKAECLDSNLVNSLIQPHADKLLL